MLRHSLVFLVGLWAASPACAAMWADGMFEEHSKDFGSVPRGPTLTYPFRLTNKTGRPVHIASVRVSCGCTTATAFQNDLDPGQTTAILAQMDTRRFFGAKTVTIFVQFDRPQWEEVRLWVTANSRDDVTVSPESLAFGQAKHGASPTATVNVTFLGNGQWQILGAQGESNYIQTNLKEVRREGGEVTYQLSARIRADTPVGKWYSDVWLNTNNPSTPRVRVPLTVEIESALSVSPAHVVLGQVRTGTEAERKVIVRGTTPFRIIAIQGTDEQVFVQDANAESKPVHVLTVTLKAFRAGDLDRTLRVRTDLKDESEVEFQAKAEIVP